MPSPTRTSPRTVFGSLYLAIAASIPWPAAAQPPVQVRFVDSTERVGLQLSGGQAAWGDCDGDGWTDLLVDGRLWRNEGGKRFELMGELTTGLLVDFDNDGDLDLFGYSDQRLFLNDGSAGFTELDLGKLPRTRSRGAAALDVDSDGWIDFYVGGFEDWDAGITYPDLLLRNEGGEGLSVAWSEERYRARGVTAADFDEDGDVDVYVSNYRLQPNLLWCSDGAGKLTETGGALGVVATSEGFGGGHSIGAAWGDFDADGHLDLFAGNFAHRDDRGDQPKSRFLRNLGSDGSYGFEDRGTCGLHYQESYASPAAGDFDNDGDLDLYFTTVYGVASFGVPNHPVLLRNDGEWAFTDVTGEAGLGELPPTYQAAWADFDRDGDLDLVSAGKLFENCGEVGSWLEVGLSGVAGACSGTGGVVGAQVRLRLGARTLTRQVEVGTGEGNQNDLVLHFGLGELVQSAAGGAPKSAGEEAAGMVHVEVRWPPALGRKGAERMSTYHGQERDQRIDLSPRHPE